MNPNNENWFRRKIEEAVFAPVQALLDADNAAERTDAVRRKPSWDAEGFVGSKF